METLREAIRRVAGLGGFLGRKSDGEPGTQILWIGLQRLDDIVAMWRVMTDATQTTVSSGIDWVKIRGYAGGTPLGLTVPAVI